MYIQSVNIAKPQLRPRNGSDVLTGGDKQPVASAYLHPLGFEGDGQGDTTNHGGEDKAVCIYSLDHYPHWEAILQRPLPPGSFSENLTILGLDEQQVCIGDIFRGGGGTAAGDPAAHALCQARRQTRRAAARQVGRRRQLHGCYMRVLTVGLVAARRPL